MGRNAFLIVWRLLESAAAVDVVIRRGCPSPTC
jgi:hypothetical protein